MGYPAKRPKLPPLSCRSLKGQPRAGLPTSGCCSRYYTFREIARFDCYHFWSGLNKLEDLDLIRNCRWDWKSGWNSEARGFLRTNGSILC
jgi:hypothetical protein